MAAKKEGKERSYAAVSATSAKRKLTMKEVTERFIRQSIGVRQTAEPTKQFKALVSTLNSGLQDPGMQRVWGEGIRNVEIRDVLRLVVAGSGAIKGRGGRPDVIATFTALLRVTLIRSRVLMGDEKTLLLCEKPSDIFPGVNEDSLSSVVFLRKRIRVLKTPPIGVLKIEAVLRNLLRNIQSADVIVAPAGFMSSMADYRAANKPWANISFGTVYSVAKIS